MTGEKLDGVLHRVASSFEKSSYGDVNGVHVPRLAVGFREDWTIIVAVVPLASAMGI